MWKMVVIVSVVIGAGCRTPYQSMGIRGGVEYTDLGHGAYVVHASVNGFTSQGTAIAYVYRRAGELCPNGYDVADRAASSSRSYWRTEYGVSEVSKPEVTLVVQCRVPAERPPEPIAKPQPSGWWCNYIQGSDVGSCVRSRAGCDRIRTELLPNGYSVAACYEQPGAFCYTRQTPDGPIAEMCTPTLSGCDFSRTSATGQALSGCAETR